MPSVIWWTIDSLRRDICSTYGGNASTKSLSNLSSNGEAYIGRSSGSWTLPSITSILTGMSKEDHKVIEKTDRRKPGNSTLPEVFRYHGWHTIGLVANPWFSRKKGLDVGFNDFYNVTEDKSLLKEVPKWKALRYLIGFNKFNGGLTLNSSKHPTEPLMVDLAIDRLSKSPQPVFMMVHTQGAHSPYHTPRGWRKSVDSSNEERSNYINLVEFVDYHLGRFLNKISSNTIIIVTSDHGEAFGEEGFRGHGNSNLDMLYDVPLIINGTNKDFSNPVSHLEVTEWLRNEIAPKNEEKNTVDAPEDTLRALGYLDGTHNIK